MWRANRPSSIDCMESRDDKKKLKQNIQSLTITETCSNFIEKCSSRRANHRSSFMRNGYISLIYWCLLREFLTSLCIMWKVWISHEFCRWIMIIFWSDFTKLIFTLNLLPPDIKYAYSMVFSMYLLWYWRICSKISILQPGDNFRLPYDFIVWFRDTVRGNKCDTPYR